MLTRIDLEHFKCFELLKLPLGRLTLLSGSNASGKSSVLQALVLLHQTIREHEWSTRLQLNGREISLGTVADVVDKVTGRFGFGIGLFDDDCHVRWHFEAEDKDKKAMSAIVSLVGSDGKEHHNPALLRFLFPEESRPDGEHLAKRLLRLSYLTAERVGPREVYPLEDPRSTQVVGPRGESGHPFAPGAAERIQVLLNTLDEFKGCFDKDGKRNDTGNRLYTEHFTGQKAWFSDSSDTEKNDFKNELTFPHPEASGKTIFATWHGKVKTPQIRIHFSWPVRSVEPLYILYVGPKITRR